MRTSYSSLNNFKTCPKKYKFKEIDKIKSKQTATLAFGNLMHKTLRFVYTPSSQGFPGKEEAIDFFVRNWKQEVLIKEGEEKGYFDDGIRIIGNYIDSRDLKERRQVIALEHHFNIKIGEHNLEGFIDRIDKTEEGFEILDYKTSQKIPPEKDLENDLQLSIYLKAFINEWPTLFREVKDTDKIKLSLYFLRHDFKLSVTRTKKDINDIEEKILDLINQVEKAKETDHFDPCPSSLCSWCDYEEICPVWSHKFKPVPKEDQEAEIQEISQKFIDLKIEKKKLEEEMKEIQEKINKYLSDSDLLQFFTQFGSVMKSKRSTYAYDPQEVAQILKKAGKDPISVMKVNTRSLNNLKAELDKFQKKSLEEAKKLERENFVLVIKNDRKTEKS